MDTLCHFRTLIRILGMTGMKVISRKTSLIFQLPQSCNGGIISNVEWKRVPQGHNKMIYERYAQRR